MELAALIALLGGFDHVLLTCAVTILSTSTVVRIIITCVKGDRDEVKKVLHREPKVPKRNAAGAGK